MKRMNAGCALLAAFFILPADAVANDETDPRGVQIAQNRAVSMYIDEQGRQVYVDRRTGQIITIRGPRQNRMAPSSGAFLPAPPTVDYGFGIEEPLQRSPAAQPDMRRFNDQFGTNHMWPDPEQRAATPPEPTPAPSPPGIRRAPLSKALPSQPALPRTAEPKPSKPADTEIAAVKPDNPAETIINRKAMIARMQVLLDRNGFSPGVIDGQYGPNMQKALDAWTLAKGTDLLAFDEAELDAALGASGGSAFVSYTITQADVRGPFVPAIPADYSQKARLETLAYTSPREMLAETFHMDENYLARLNPGANFDAPGTTIRVAAPATNRTGTVTRIVADKALKQLRAYDAQRSLMASYPATIGSTDTPSPSGKVTVERIAFDPDYTYNPAVNFKQGDNDRVLVIPPGPNGPVGSIWIALSKPTYGIHGTPEPDRIGKTYSHGCIRLTNWDAYELARMVDKGVTVEFTD